MITACVHSTTSDVWLWKNLRSLNSNAGCCEGCPLKWTVSARSQHLYSQRAEGARCAHVKVKGVISYLLPVYFKI